MKFLIHILCLCSLSSAFSQSISVNTDGSSPHSSAALDIKSVSKGILIPRMTESERNSIPAPATGLMIYQTNNASGFYYFNGSAWTAVASASESWLMTGNTGTDPENHFIGTSDNQPLRIRINNLWGGELNSANKSIAIGDSSGAHVTIGQFNTSLGHRSLLQNQSGINNVAIGYLSLFRNTASNNVAIGFRSLENNTEACCNTGLGSESLTNNQTGWGNAAVGFEAMNANLNGYGNVALGFTALKNNVSGYNNVAIGFEALNDNTNGDDNIAIGKSTMYYNTSGSFNTAVGRAALQYCQVDYNTAIGYKTLWSSNAIGNTAVGARAMEINTSGAYNVAMGNSALGVSNGSYNSAFGSTALVSNTSGANNTAIGYIAMLFNTTGMFNTAIGSNSLYGNTVGSNNTTIGGNSLGSNITGDNNVALGYAAGPNTSLNNTVAIGSYVTTSSDNYAMFGNTSTTWNGGNVGWSVFSDERIKTNVQEDVKGLDFISRLRPVTYYRDIEVQAQLTGNTLLEDYPQKYDIEQIRFSGFLAQEVEQAAIASSYEFSGITTPRNPQEVYTLSYESFVVPLVKAVQEHQVLIEELRHLYESQLKVNIGLENRIKVLEETIQKSMH